MSEIKIQELQELQEITGYRFLDVQLLKTALTHSSYANERKVHKIPNNERLEFLGDAVLELAVSEFLFAEKPHLPEGEMTKLRASLVCEPTLDICARSFGLERFLLLGKGEEATGGRGRASIVSDAFEALIGAIYLDGGFTNAKEFIRRFVLDDMEHLQIFCDSKTILQELVQKKSKEPLQYELVDESGPDHNKHFRVQVMHGSQIIGRGEGKSKKTAEQHAAYEAIMLLKKQSSQTEE